MNSREPDEFLGSFRNGNILKLLTEDLRLSGSR